MKPRLPSVPGNELLAAESMNTRKCIVERKVEMREATQELSKEARTHPVNSPERNRLYQLVQSQHDGQARLEGLLQSDFLPQHGPRQLLSPRAFFVSPLFRVCSKRLTRERSVALDLKNAQGDVILRYQGPELRQSDGLIFMALLNLVRDVRTGERVSFTADDVCRTVFGRYDGPTRASLKDHIKRLQRGLIEFDNFSVQLCLRFEFPARGTWSVALDKDIVQLFRRSPEVWLDLPKRLALPEGLSTWLYAFIESQTRLIPASIESLRALCGSDASSESFPRTLRLALKELSRQEVIDEGWSMKGGTVHWRKCKGSGVSGDAALGN